MTHRLYKVMAMAIFGEYTLRLEFDDGAIQVIDFAPILFGELYGPLRDLNLFNQVALDPVAHTVIWPNGADFDPETLRHWPDYVEELSARVRGKRTAAVA